MLFSLVQPPFDAEDILRAVFCGQFVLQLSLSADRPIRLFQLTIVPVSIHVFEGVCVCVCVCVCMCVCVCV